MTNPSFDSLASDITLHTPWMRRLAASLIHDSASADDVVQESWSVMIRREEPQGLAAPVSAGFLASIVRSLTRRSIRSDRRRRERETHAARPEALPPTAEIAEQAEIVQRLASALDELEDPYRATLVMRYFDGLSSAEIARRSDIPAATVRTRLKRGLDQMRVQMDDKEGGRSYWVSALVPALERPAHASSALSLSLASFAMLKIVIGTAATLCGAAFLWIYLSDDSVPQDTAVSLPEQVAPDQLTQERSTIAAGDDASERALVAESLRPETQTNAPDATFGRVIISASAVDQAQRPIDGAWIRLRNRPDRVAKSDETGSARLELSTSVLERLSFVDTSGLVQVQVGAPGYCASEHRFEFDVDKRLVELGQVALSLGASVIGTVVDENGLGVEGALVVFGVAVEAEQGSASMERSGPSDLRSRPWLGPETALTSESGPGGQFIVDGVAAGHGTLWARSDSTLWAYSPTLGLRVGEQLSGIELVVREASEQIITGKLLDPDDRPIAGLPLTFTKTSAEDGWFDGKTDRNGRFYFVPKEGAAQNIGARSPSWEWEDLSVLDVEPGTPDLVLRFVASKWLSLSLIDTDGLPLHSGKVEGLPPDGPTDNSIHRCESPIDADGHARLRWSAGPVRLRAQSPGYRDLVLGPLDTALLADPFVITLESVPALVGMVSLASGEPAANARVSLHRRAGSGGSISAAGVKAATVRTYLTHQGWPGDGDAFVYGLFVDPSVAVHTDDEGRFRLPLPGVDTEAEGEVERSKASGLAGMGYAGETNRVKTSTPAQEWYLHARLASHATVLNGPHQFDGKKEVQLDLRMPRSGSIDGLLIMDGSTSPAGWTARASDGMAQIAEAPISADGSFRMDHLHAGAWQISVFEPGKRFYEAGGRLRTERVPEPVVDIVPGRTVEYQHRATLKKSARLEGRLSVNAVAPGAWQVIVRTTTKQASIQSMKTSLDPDGRFEVTLEPGLSTSLTLSKALSSGGLTITTKLTIVPGMNRWSYDLGTAKIKGQIDTDLLGTGRIDGPSYLSESGGLEFRTRVKIDNEGNISETTVPAGPGLLRAARLGFRDQPPVLAELDLEAGEIRVLDLR
ncbi:MAG: RNA polymerase sigma-70 factor (ECF subfamily) [Planctomycetota bacterium]|jgi:RNA polymerase sigma-70 factor (ECF subfamily)